MTDGETLRVLTYLRAAFPRQPLGEDTIAVYRDAIRTLGYEEVFAAARRHVATKAFWPSISELVAPIAEAAVGAEPAEQAWLEVTRAVSRWGRYRPWPFANAITARAVEAIGKDQICDSENLGIERAHFLRIYASYHGTELGEAKAAPLLGREYQPLEQRTGQVSAAAALRLVPVKAGES